MRENESNERKATRAARLAAIPPLPTTPEHLRETIDEDDLCPICQQLLHQPVKTTCNHTVSEWSRSHRSIQICQLQPILSSVCGGFLRPPWRSSMANILLLDRCANHACMAHWTDVSVTSQMSIVDVDEEPVAFDAVAGLEAKCPMCRQQTSAALDAARGNHLDTAYPRTARRRRVEEENDTLSEGREGGIQTMTVYIGNRHHQIEASDANQHDWTFFVRPSRPEMIEEVHIDLHPTFNPPRIIRGRPPYDIRRLGWGTFTITANVMLKAGYSWLSGDAIDSPDGAKKGTLPLEWTLDFSGFGGKGSMDGSTND